MERLKHLRVQTGRAINRYRDRRALRGYRAANLAARDLSKASTRKSLRLKLEVFKLKYLP